MTAATQERQDMADVALDITPMEMDAGVSITLKGSAKCNPAVDLTGCILSLIDDKGADRGEMTLSDFDGEASFGSVEITAPVTPGQYIWTGRLLPGTATQSTPEIASGGEAGLVFELTFEVRAHRTDVVVWDVQPAIEHGSKFEMLVGLRCSAGCDLSGQKIEIRDEHDGHLATVETGAEPREGTEALYWARVELDAPQKEGRYRWQAVAESEILPRAHDGDGKAFVVNAVPVGKHRLRVEVRDAETAAPIPRAKVVAHPYRAFTDEAGFAELLLPPGMCTLMVSGPDHYPFQLEGEVKDDMVIEAVLDRDRPLSEADIWI